VLQVLGEIDGRHSARAKLTLDAVSVGKRGGETCELVGHSTAKISMITMPE
jgi:hypothetical protein